AIEQLPIFWSDGHYFCPRPLVTLHADLGYKDLGLPCCQVAVVRDGILSNQGRDNLYREAVHRATCPTTNVLRRRQATSRTYQSILILLLALPATIAATEPQECQSGPAYPVLAQPVSAEGE